MALTGGEDYELLFTAGPQIMNKVIKVMPCPVTVVGEITTENTGKVKLVGKKGKPFTIKKTGWDHFNIG
jgi:thiamine monophosphate kinase